MDSSSGGSLLCGAWLWKDQSHTGTQFRARQWGYLPRGNNHFIHWRKFGDKIVTYAFQITMDHRVSVKIIETLARLMELKKLYSGKSRYAECIGLTNFVRFADGLLWRNLIASPFDLSAQTRNGESAMEQAPKNSKEFGCLSRFQTSTSFWNIFRRWSVKGGMERSCQDTHMLEHLCRGLWLRQSCHGSRLYIQFQSHHPQAFCCCGWWCRTMLLDTHQE